MAIDQFVLERCQLIYIEFISDVGVSFIIKRYFQCTLHTVQTISVIYYIHDNKPSQGRWLCQEINSHVLVILRL